MSEARSAVDTGGPASAFAEIDRRFARMIATLAGDEEAALLERTAALLSRARTAGHSCIMLDEWAGRAVELGGESELLPDRDAWQAVLERSDVVGDGSVVTPLVHEDGRVYLYRYWTAERRVARALGERAMATALSDRDLEALAPAFANAFPESSSDASPAGEDAEQVDWQAVAAAAALAGRLAVISGGPGTGKTTTVARILVLLAHADADARMTVAAPTGKAAARIGESLTAELGRMELADEIRERIPSQAATLHRLLGASPDGRFRFDANRRLPHDVIVVDEASMVDLLLMDALLAAARPSARIVLLGDEDQLASVEAGFVFADLCRAARVGGEAAAAPSTALADAYRTLAGRDLSSRPVTSGTSGRRLTDAAVVLRRTYRFGPESGIGRLANAVRRGDADAALDVLSEGHEDVTLRPLPTPVDDDSLGAAAYLAGARDEILAADGPGAAIERLGRARILCAGRAGPWGTEGLNASVEGSLVGGGAFEPAGERWYRGRPVMVTANDYGAGLFNGDVGVCWPDGEDGRSRIWFPTSSGQPRPVAPARLPAHETAWAMTVHKSQGSEFDSVLMILPPEESPLCTRELIYTGLTRAKRELTIVAEPALLRSAIERRATRSSGLLEVLSRTSGQD